MSEAFTSNISALEAWEMLVQDNNTALVDVRTKEEWLFVGRPSLPDKEPNNILLMIEWRQLPSMDINFSFIESLKSEIKALDTKILFLCRSGHRSREACEFINAQGYLYCYNIKDGFEGPLDNKGHRGQIAGWKKSGLPWQQS